MEFPECTFCMHMTPVHESLHACMRVGACPDSTFSLWPVLSADRVEQMTKTYNDMEVVTQLLAEVGVPSLVNCVFSIKKQHLIGCDSVRSVLSLDSGTETWSWPLGLVSHFCRGTTCCKNATRP